jgi:hypothetical protein
MDTSIAMRIVENIRGERIHDVVTRITVLLKCCVILGGKEEESNSMKTLAGCGGRGKALKTLAPVDSPR